MDPRIELAVVAQSLRHVGRDKPGRKAVGLDATRRPSGTHHLGQCREAGLGRGVGPGPTADDPAVYRADVDYLAAPAFDAACDLLGQHEAACEVRRNHMVPVVETKRDQFARTRDTGVVGQDVNAAALLLDLGHRRPGRLAGVDVERRVLDVVGAAGLLAEAPAVDHDGGTGREQSAPQALRRCPAWTR